MPQLPDQEDIQEEFDEVLASVADGERRYPGMSYGEGVRDALAWVLGERDEKPYTEGDD